MSKKTTNQCIREAHRNGFTEGLAAARGAEEYRRGFRDGVTSERMDEIKRSIEQARTYRYF